MTSITDFLKKGEFNLTNATTRTFDDIKQITKAPVLSHPNFDKVFEVACDASDVDIEGILESRRSPYNTL